MNENIRSIEQNLKVLRVLHDLRQADVAEKLGISQQMYSKYEKGTSVPDAETVKKLCRIYNVSADLLLGLDEERAAREAKAGVPSSEIDAIVSRVLSAMRESR